MGWTDITASLSYEQRERLETYAEYHDKNNSLFASLAKYPRLRERYRGIEKCGHVLSGSHLNGLQPSSYCRKPNACHLCNTIRTKQYADQFTASVEAFADRVLRSSRMKVIPVVVQFPYGHGEFVADRDLPEIGERIRVFTGSFSTRRRNKVRNYYHRSRQKGDWRSKVIGPTTLDVHVIPEAVRTVYDRYARRMVRRRLPPRLHVHLLVSTGKRANRKLVRSTVEHAVRDAYAGQEDLIDTATGLDGLANVVRLDTAIDWKTGESVAELADVARYCAKHTKRTWTPNQVAESISILDQASLIPPHKLLGKYAARGKLPDEFDPKRLRHKYLVRLTPDIQVLEREQPARPKAGSEC